MQKYITSTHFKSLNLYLYPTFNSAHPKGTFNGMIHGMLKIYHKQNQLSDDFNKVKADFYQRLCNRGYPTKYLDSKFETALQKIKNGTPSSPKNVHKHFFIIHPLRSKWSL